MRRLESAARDYAIALVAARRLHGIGDVLRRIDLRLARDVEDAEAEVCETTYQLDGIRIVRARLALYLRLMRRVEAWERGGWVPARWALAPGRYTGPGASGLVAKWPSCTPIDWEPWRPLWLDAPPHEAGVTARTRRERVGATLAAMHGAGQEVER